MYNMVRRCLYVKLFHLVIVYIYSRSMSRNHKAMWHNNRIVDIIFVAGFNIVQSPASVLL